MFKINGFLPKKQDYKAKSPHSDEAGSVIIWIFLMIAIFAALNYVMSSGTRSGSASITKEKANLAATEILDYGRTLKNAVQQLQINGCSDTEVSFENSTVPFYTNPNAPTDKSCHVFDSNGGGLRYDNIIQNNSLNSYAYYFSGITNIQGVGTDCTNPTCAELYLFVAFDNNDGGKAICESLNNLLGHDDLVPLITTGHVSHSPSFTGTYGPYNPTWDARLKNRTSACYKHPLGNYVHYYVLIAR